MKPESIIKCREDPFDHSISLFIKAKGFQVLRNIDYGGLDAHLVSLLLAIFQADRV